ncbi:uncharacterized protein AMSG_02581 [Thecamonas trahens ATCC 50062]|uniref:DUF7630 domain-containing protein n=1 Tax=Thecamonas trahens ATCC 50062 TaxID=461836 RepID=A0A0L0D655_THETB|nr:hypothetical protein AMSG_02581 [Thecamonas trahens ATCC 50062]KNC47556.1 hypothetical protein AMSG_02581 [Thecamonas trahens ATCC 50062]|eukprot:XP_013759488.1 hypothetical protein AMSG_02581 [Thecamonas trahens ATCC 50062]
MSPPTVVLVTCMLLSFTTWCATAEVTSSCVANTPAVLTAVVSEVKKVAAVAAFDANSDGLVDVFAMDKEHHSLQAFANNGLLALLEPVVVDGAYSRSYATELLPADVDGDGRTDLVVLARINRPAKEDFDSAFWYRNLAEGSGGPIAFSERNVIAHSFLGGAALAVGDLDGDSHVDAVVAISSTGEIWLYPNSFGNGTFGLGRVVIWKENLKGIADIELVDIGSDGMLDVVAAVQLDNSYELNWHRNDGAGVFNPLVTRSSVEAKTFVQGEVNNDGYPDLVIGTGTELYVLTGNSNGFNPMSGARNFAYAADGVFVGDFDGDGWADVGAFGTTKYSVWPNNGAGDFATSSEHTTPVYAAAVADMDNDGSQDLVLGYKHPESVKVLVQYSAAEMSVPSTTYDFVAHGYGDVDGDGDVDAVAATSQALYWVPAERSDATAHGVPIALPTWQFGDSAQDLAVVDLDGDSDPDLVVSRDGQPPVWLENLGGLGNFGAGTVLAGALRSVGDVVVADVDGNGLVDIVVRELGSGSALQWFSQTSSGTFAGAAILAAASPRASILTFTVADLDGAGLVDVVFLEDDGLTVNVTYVSADGGGGFSAPTVLKTSFGSPCRSLQVGDVNADGLADVVVGCGVHIHLLYGEGSGVFDPGSPIVLDSSVDDILLRGRPDGHGMDLVVYDVFGLVRTGVLRRERTWGMNQLPLFASLYAFESPVVVDMDGDGVLDVAALTTTVTMVWANGLSSPRSASFIDSIVGSDGSADGLAVCDVSGNGFVDVVTRNAEGKVLIFAGSSSGVASSADTNPSLVGQSKGPVLCGDIDGDGSADVISGGAVFYNTDGTGPKAANMVSDEIVYTDAALGDVDEDGRLDAVFADADGLWWAPALVEDRSEWSIQTTAIGCASISVSDVVLGEIDGDGHVDAVAVCGTDVTWFSNVDGTGTFSSRPTLGAEMTGSGGLVDIGDFDANGAMDVVAVDTDSGTVSWMRNLGGGVFDAPVIISLNGQGATGLAVGDIDSDGALSIVVVGGRGVSVPRRAVAFVLVGDGAGHFVEHMIPTDNAALTSVVLSDMNRDGRLDMVVGVDDWKSFQVYTREAHGPFSRHVPRQLVVDPSGDTECGVSAGRVGFDCVWRRVMQTSQCARDEVVLPAGITDLELSSMTIANLGVARKANRGTPGLRVQSSDDSAPRGALVLDRVRVVGGRADDSVSPFLVGLGIGGAVAVDVAGTLDVRNSILTDCSAQSYGGAISGRGSGVVITIVDSVIEQSTAGIRGGGLFVATGAQLAVTRSNVTANVAGTGAGGGLAVEFGADAYLLNARLAGNVAAAGIGGGGVVRPGSALTLERSSVSGNLALAGGGLAVAAIATEAAMVVNAVTELPRGTVLDAPAANTLDIRDTAFSSNHAATYGGGLLVCGAQVAVDGPTVTMSNNVAGRGGALESSADVMSCAPESGNNAWLVVTGGSAQFPEASAPLGSQLDGTFRVLDLLSRAAVSYANTEFQVAVTSGASSLVVDGPQTMRGESGEVALPGAILYADAESVDEAALPRVELVVTSANAELGFLAAPIQLTACGPQAGGIELVLDSGARVVGCVDCGAGVSGETSLAGCVTAATCLANSVENGGVNGTQRCVCEGGFYAVGADPNQYAVECAACPVGAICRKGRDPPLAAEGFYGESNTSFVRCRRPGACLGGHGSACAPGYSGYMCNDCKDGWYSNTARECAKCPAAAVGALVGGGLILVVVAGSAAVFVAIAVARSHDFAADTGKAVSGALLRRRLFPASISMVVVAIQVIGLVSEAEFGWGESTQRLLLTLNIFNIDLNLFASECTLASFHAKYAFSVAAPVVLLAASMCALVIARKTMMKARLERVRTRALFDAVLFTLAPVLYIPMARAALVIFDCVSLPNGQFVLDSDPSVRCLDASWWTVAPLGALAVVAYVIGLPAYSLSCIASHREALLEPAVFARFGSLYLRYRLPYYWGGVAELGKRLALVVVAVFASDHVFVLIVLLFGILIGSSGFVIRKQPYYFPLYNKLDARLTAVLLFLVLVGTGSYAERGAGAVSDAAFLVLVIAALVALVVIGGHAIISDVVSILRSRRRLGADETGTARQRALAAHIQREAVDLEPQLARELVAIAERLEQQDWEEGGAVDVEMASLVLE